MAEQRGRKSAAGIASLSVVTIGMKERPKVPKAFRADSVEAQIWRLIVEAESADWFHAGDLPLLEAYCAATANYRRISKEADGQPFVLAGVQGGAIANPIFRMQDMLAKQMAALATKLRLAQSTRVSGHEAGSTAKKNVKSASGDKPWQHAV